ncbi:hypothetical protein AAEO50_02160 [Rossellomorea oryzaecorticis]|uniref:Uncharacterized protein n=1 Tax=Rossellomorea oryzaecorticis TaxID=1396505 RepID=A0ABU9K4T6_9BACI
MKEIDNKNVSGLRQTAKMAGLIREWGNLTVSDGSDRDKGVNF